MQVQETPVSFEGTFYVTQSPEDGAISRFYNCLRNHPLHGGRPLNPSVVSHIHGNYFLISTRSINHKSTKVNGLKKTTNNVKS